MSMQRSPWLLALALAGACASQRDADPARAAPPQESAPPRHDAPPAMEAPAGGQGMDMGSMGAMGAPASPDSARGGAADRAPGEPGPALTRLPPPPSIVRPARPVLPDSCELPRDGWVADRFTAEGQRVLYPFVAEEGELSLFDFAAWGYARAWEATAAFEIQDAAGRTVLDRLSSGGASWREFIPFTAPARGRYVLALSARSSFYRYVVVRHSGYAAREPGELLEPLEEGLRHGYVLDTEDRARYPLELEAGEEVALKVLDTDEEIVAHWRTVKAHGGVEPRRGGAPPYAELRLRVLRDGEPLGPAAHYRLLRAKRAGTYVVEVEARRGRGALFDLVVDRAPRREAVRGLVLDRFDDPVAGVTLAFMRLPDLDFAGRVTTDAEGRYATRLPPGPYQIELSRDGDQRTRTIETEVRGERELNTIW